MNQLPLSNRPIQYGFIIIPFLSAFLMLTMGYQSLSAQSKVHEEGAFLESSAFKLSPSAVKQSSSTPDSVNLQWHLTNIPQLELNNGSHDDLATNSSLRLGFQSQNLPAIETAITFDPPFTLTTAISDQQQAAIAYNPGDDNAVAVWWDTQSDAGDIYAAHFDQNGLLTSVPIRVNSVITGEQSQAAIAFSPTSDLYLVVWADKRAGGSWDIYGRLLDATGTPQGGELPLAVSNRARTAPDIVYDPSSDSFMVVWQQRTDGVTLNDIAAQLINSDGSLGNGFLLSNTGDQDYAPALATDGSGGFLAAWRRGPASGDSDLYGQRFTATGLVGGEIVISNAVGAQRRLDVAHHAGMANGAGVYFIGWDDDRTATRQVYGQYVAGDGTLIAGNFRIDASPGANATYAAAAPMGEYIAVGWRQAGNLYLRLVEEDGSLGVPQLLSDAGKLQHQIAFAPSSTGLWAVWESSQDNGDGIDDDNIYAAQLWLSPQQAALTLADSVTVTQTMSDQLNVTLAANPTSGDYLMVFEDMQNGDADLAAQIVDGDGLPQNAPIAIHTVLTNTQQKAAAAYSPDADRYLIVWEDRANDAQRGDILGRLAAADGSLIGAPFVIADTNRALAAPKVAYDPPSGNFLVVWQQSNGATTKQDIMGQVVGSDGALGAPFIISGDGAQDFTPKLATDGQGEYLVVWRRGVADSGTEILYQKATMSGTVGVSHTVTVSPSLPGDMLRPVAAYNAAADNYLIVWEQNNAIYGQAVAADGLAEGNSIRLDNNSGSVPHWPQVTSIPDGFVAAWQHAGNLSVRHLAADGTPGMVYLLSDAIRAQRRPALASAGNTLLAAWESNEGATGDYDIYARQISVGEPSQLLISKQAPTSAFIGDPVTYTLTVTNVSDITATNLIITDQLPINANYISGGQLISDVVEWQVAALAPQSSVQVTFVVSASNNLVNQYYGVMADDDLHGSGKEIISTQISANLPNGFWWNDDYFYRRAITLTTQTPITEDFASQTASFSMDVTSLVEDGKMDDAGQDVRLTYRDEFGWHIVPVEINNPISPTLVVTFPIQSPITNSIDSYWLYYGYRLASGGEHLNALDFDVNQLIYEISGTTTTTPTVLFYANERGAWVNTPITFTSIVTPDADSYLWDFGDGISGTSTNTTHSYSLPGAYTVTLTTVMSDGVVITYGIQSYIQIWNSVSDQISVTVGAEEIPIITETITAQGGQFENAESDLTVIFPTGAISNTIVVTHTPYQATVAQNAGVLSRFSLNAATITGQTVTQFDGMVTLVQDIAQFNLTVDEIALLSFYYWDEPGYQWMPITTTINVTQGIATGIMDHFTDIALTADLGEANLSRLPTASPGKVDLFTGSSTYQLGFEMPPGTHGVQPNLGLVYNSGSADTLLNEQAGIVGHGFELTGLGWIQKYQGDYYLNLNGVSEKLIPDNVFSNTFHTEHETFWQIEQKLNGYNETVDGEYWVVTDQNGIQYRFGYYPDSTLIYEHPDETVSVVQYPYYFALDTLWDTYSNTVSVRYQQESQTTYFIPPYSSLRNTLTHETSLQPQLISYTINSLVGLPATRMISFTYTQTNKVDALGRRIDYAFEKDRGPGRVYGNEKALENIQMWVDKNGDGNFELVRQYDLGYRYYTQNGETPSSSGPEKYHLMLASITERDSSGLALPATTFTYKETGHLSSINNGYGGIIQFDYEPVEAIKKAYFLGNWGYTSAYAGFQPDEEDDRWRVIQKTVGTTTGEDHQFSYMYSPASFYEKQFRGHQQVIELRPDNSLATTYFSQGFYTIFEPQSNFVPNHLNERLWGKPYRQEIWSGSSLLQSRLTSYEILDIQDAVYLALPSSVTLYSVNGPSNVTLFDYDNLGRVMTTTMGGSTITKTRFSEVTYANPVDVGGLYQLPLTVTLKAHDTSIVAQTNYAYAFNGNSPTILGITTTQKSLVTNSPDVVSHITFDGVGNIKRSWTGDSTNAIEQFYDPVHHTYPITISYPISGMVESVVYLPEFGLPKTITDVNGFQQTFSYDGFGRLKSNNGSTGLITYDYYAHSTGLDVSQKQHGAPGIEDDLVNSLQYNGLGQLTRAINYMEGDGILNVPIYTSYKYDGLGRVISTSLPYTDTVGRSLLNSYDALGRPLSVESLDGVTSYNYYAGNQVAVTPALGGSTLYQLDSFGQVKTVTNISGTTSYDYNALGNLTKIVDANGHLTTMSYDGLGRKLSMNDPNVGFWGYSYNEQGLLENQIDARGVTTTLAYDPLGRVTTISYTVPSNSDVVPTADITYQYDGGLLTEMNDGSGSTTWGYNSAGFMVGEDVNILGNPFQTAYSYDDFGRLAAMTYPDGEVVTYTYNLLGQVVNMAGDDVYLADASYNLLGQPTMWGLGSVVTQTTAYHPSTFKPLSSQIVNGSGLIQNLTFEFNAVGNLSKFVDVGNDFRLIHHYDGLHQLTDVVMVSDSGAPIIPLYDQHYSYDEVGNLLNRNGRQMQYDVARPQLVVTDSLGVSYGYDANGNMVSRSISNTMVVSYTYDAANRLTKIVSGTQTTTYLYDGNGDRVKRTQPSGGGGFIVGNHFEGQLQEAVVNISNSVPDSYSPCMALKNGTPHFVWAEDGAIFYKGLLGTAVNITAQAGATITMTQQAPAIAVGLDGTLHVVWHEFDSIGGYKGSNIFYSSSSNGGVTWAGRTNVSAPYDSTVVFNDPIAWDYADGIPNIGVSSNGDVHIIWRHRAAYGGTDGNEIPTLLYRNLPSGDPIVTLAPIYNFGKKADMAVEGNGTVHVVWDTNLYSHSNSEVYYKKWDGNSWGSDQLLSSGNGYASDPAIGIDDLGQAHVVWRGQLDSYPLYQIDYKKVGQTGYVTLSGSAPVSAQPDITATGNGLLFTSWITATGGLYFSEYDGFNWSMPTATPLAPYPNGTGSEIPCELAYDNGLHMTFNGEISGTLQILYSGPVIGDKIKRYFVGNNMVALRANETLHFNLSDPTGSSTTMVDEHGDVAGQLLVDAYGGVLTNTLPVTLTRGMAGLPDPDGGLTYLGNGRYYDPMLGRPLQPNPATAPPTLPQALNRYAATPVGQPGVFQAVQGNTFNWIPSTVSFGYGLTTQLAGKYGHSVTGIHHTGYGLIEVTASNSALTRNFRSLPNSFKKYFNEPVFSFAENGRNFYTRHGLVPSANRSLHELYKATDEVVASLQDILPRHGPWSAKISSQITTHTWQISKRLNQLDNWKSSVTRIGTGLDFAIGFGFQFANDYGSPYLTFEKTVLRSTVAGTGSALLGGVGGAIGFLCGPAVIICTPVGSVVGGLVWSELIQPRIFQLSILKPEEKNLQPLFP